MKKIIVFLVLYLMPICLIAGSGDRNVNKAYIDAIVNFIMGKTSVSKDIADANQDGKVNAADIVEAYNIINRDNNDLPDVLVVTEDIEDWSEMRICKDGTFMLSKSVNDLLNEIDILCPDESQGLVFSRIIFDDNGYPIDMALENIRLLFDWKDDKCFDVTLFDSEGNIYKYESLNLQESEISLSRTRVPRVDDQKPVIARVGGALNVLSGAISIGAGVFMVSTSGILEIGTAGSSTLISVPGAIIGGLSIRDGVVDIRTGLYNAFSNDYYEGENPLGHQVRDEMIRRCVVPRVPDRYFAYIVDDKNQQLYSRIGWANLGLGLIAGNMSNIRPAYTSNDLRRDIMANVYTGIYKDVTYNSVTLRGYVNPYILSDPKGAFDTEYGILVYSNDNDRQHKNITNGNGGMIEFSFDNLKHGTTYYYRTYYNDKTHSIGYLSDIKSFQTKNYNLPTITNFKVTKSQYSKGAFTNDGKSYDYCFNASVTISYPLADRVNVEEWGYVYKDPNGKTKKISISTTNSEFVDNRYVYYRNQSVSTACLYPYIKFNGMDELIYGDHTEYDLIYAYKSCPDSNHPHWIDLGLPSGTLWRCCNEGASTPEEFGGYYEFGQVSSAPSAHQVYELMDNTPSSPIIQNGVKGRKFTGSNGGAIFLPGAGRCVDGEFSGDDSGHYWSSARSGYYSFGGIYFYSIGADWSDGSRSYGLSLRPVR